MNHSFSSSLQRERDDPEKEEFKVTAILKEINNYMGTRSSVDSDYKVERINHNLNQINFWILKLNLNIGHT